MENTIEAECNECEWHGLHKDMNQRQNDEDVLSCPKCSSWNVYHFKEPPIFTENANANKALDMFAKYGADEIVRGKNTYKTKK